MKFVSGPTMTRMTRHHTPGNVIFFTGLMLVAMFTCTIAAPNTCYRCDFQGGKKVKMCPQTGFSVARMEVAECSYEKPYCGFTINVTEAHQVIYAGCYSKPYKKHCFRDRVKHYGPLNSTYCYHTCGDYFCNPHVTWLNRLASDPIITISING